MVHLMEPSDSMEYVLKAFVDFIFSNIIARLFFNWWVVILADSEGYLPTWLKWFQTFDNSLDEGWKGGTYNIAIPRNRWELYTARVKWLWRNSAYGFSYWPMGREFKPEEWNIVQWDDHVRHLKGPRGQFSYFYQGKWGQLKLGWKAWNMWDENTNAWRTAPWGPEWRIPIVFGYTPFKRA